MKLDRSAKIAFALAVWPVVAWSLTAAAARAQTAGVPTEWDTRKTLSEISAQVKRWKPLLDQMRPQDWIAKGAPDTYVAQLKSAQAELGYLLASTQQLARDPEKLSVTLETLFRMQALESMLESLGEGIRRYQNPALADLLRGIVAENAGNRDKLRQYAVELAALREQEFQVMNREAQRCRAKLSKQPPAEREKGPEPK